MPYIFQTLCQKQIKSQAFDYTGLKNSPLDLARSKFQTCDISFVKGRKYLCLVHTACGVAADFLLLAIAEKGVRKADAVAQPCFLAALRDNRASRPTYPRTVIAR